MYYEDGWVLGNHKTAAKLVGDEWKPITDGKNVQFGEGIHTAPLTLLAHLMNHVVTHETRERMDSDRFTDKTGRACFLSSLVVMYNDQDQLLLMLPLEAASSSKDGYTDDDFVHTIQGVLSENGLHASSESALVSNTYLKTHEDGMPFRIIGSVDLTNAHDILKTMRAWCEKYDLDSRYPNHLDNGRKVSLFPDLDHAREAQKIHSQLEKAGYSVREIQSISKLVQEASRGDKGVIERG